MPGLSALALDDGVVYHTDSSYARGLDAVNGAYQLLDLAPKGRDEDDLGAPARRLRGGRRGEAMRGRTLEQGRRGR